LGERELLFNEGGESVRKRDESENAGGEGGKYECGYVEAET
jgi:hypothetical protein